MSGRKKLNGKRLKTDLYQRSLTYITMLFGFTVTFVITVINCLVTLFMENNLQFEDVAKPLFYGAIITPLLALLLNKYFSEVEQARSQVEDLQKQETQLKTSLTKTYIAMINQREKNNTLFREHEKLQGSFYNEISLRQEAQSLLDEQMVFFSAIFDLTPDIILYRSFNGEIKGCSDNLLHLLHVENRAELESLFSRDPELNECFCFGDDEVIKTKKDIMYERTISGVIYQVRKRPAINPKGQLIGTMIYGHDITKLKNEQDVLERASREKSNFISTLSHELRTPLNGIVGLSDILLQTGHFKGEDERNLKAVNVSAVTLGNIFNDVIDLNKFERQTFSVAPEPFDWKGFLEDLETLSRLMTEQKNLSFSFKVTGESPDRVVSDQTRLRQILWNLIANGIKFTKKGGIAIAVSQKTNPDGKLSVSFEIADTGIGIAPEEQEKIFGLYYQVPGTKQSTGTGIGLYVTRELTRALGGSIQLDSQPGRGTTFTVSFNCEIQKRDSEPKPGTDARKVLKSLNILLVEDVDLNILVCKTMLEKLGNRVRAAKTGAEALELFKSETPDLVLLDIQLPDMSGLDVADHLREDFKSEVPMLALTANVMRDPEIYAGHGIAGVLSKPLSASRLAEAITEFRENAKSN
ncbi:ATP-binding protein [Succinimonas sp.]|uniref:ATP-binding protein n=1 Tax=Succinimonas sp. TaxID=1936151 RepID=UPI003866F3A3